MEGYKGRSVALIFMPVLFPDSNRDLVNGSQRRRALSSTSAAALGSHREQKWHKTWHFFALSFLLDFFGFVFPFHASVSSLNHWTVIHILFITLCPWFYLLRLVQSLMSQQQSQHSRVEAAHPGFGSQPGLPCWVLQKAQVLSPPSSSFKGVCTVGEQISMLYRGEVSSGSLQNIFDVCSVQLLLYALKFPFWESSKDEEQCPNRAQLISVSDVLLCPLVCMRLTTLYLVSSNFNDSALKSCIYSQPNETHKYM